MVTETLKDMLWNIHSNNTAQKYWFVTNNFKPFPTGTFSAFSCAVREAVSEAAADELSPAPEVPEFEQPARSNAARSAAAVNVFFIFVVLSWFK